MTVTDIGSEPMAAPQAAAAVARAPTRPFLWSLRREIWENRSIYIAPAAIAGLVLAGLAIGAMRIPPAMVHFVSRLSVEKRGEILSVPFYVAAAAIMATAFVVAVFYCLGALHGERRDRTILFWKSMPVSDLTAVLAKATVPLLVLPLVTFATVFLALLVLLVGSLAVFPALGLPATFLWSAFPPVQAALDMLYFLTVSSLWYAPIWAWLLLVSGWARRVPILWAFAPPFGLAVFELLAFDSNNVWKVLHDRFSGAVTHAYATSMDAKGHIQVDMHQPAIAKLVESPDFWIGLVVAVVLLAAAVWQRRWRTPI